MFKVDKEFKSANISRTIRFTESLFEQLNKTAAENKFHLTCLCCNAVNTRLTIKRRMTTNNQ